MQKKILGIVGGIGPLATVHFMEMILEMTDARTDQDNVDMIVYNFPSIPDRTGYILGSNLKSPLPGLRSAARALAQQKATCIAIPCVTAHYFYRELQEGLPVPILNAAEETGKLLRTHGIRKVGIMATDGTIRSGILSRELDRAGILPVIPSPQHQADVMHLIYEDVKAGKPADMQRFQAVAQELWDCGAEVILLGCTELSVIRRQQELGAGFVDVMEVLARASILATGKHLKPQFEDLIKEGDIHAAQYSGISGKNCSAGAGKSRIFLRG